MSTDPLSRVTAGPVGIDNSGVSKAGIIKVHSRKKPIKQLIQANKSMLTHLTLMELSKPDFIRDRIRKPKHLINYSCNFDVSEIGRAHV